MFPTANRPQDAVRLRSRPTRPTTKRCPLQRQGGFSFRCRPTIPMTICLSGRTPRQSIPTAGRQDYGFHCRPTVPTMTCLSGRTPHRSTPTARTATGPYLPVRKDHRFRYRPAVPTTMKGLPDATFRLQPPRRPIMPQRSGKIPCKQPVLRTNAHRTTATIEPPFLPPRLRRQATRILYGSTRLLHAYRQQDARDRLLRADSIGLRTVQTMTSLSAFPGPLRRRGIRPKRTWTAPLRQVARHLRTCCSKTAIVATGRGTTAATEEVSNTRPVSPERNAYSACGITVVTGLFVDCLQWIMRK